MINASWPDMPALKKIEVISNLVADDQLAHAGNHATLNEIVRRRH